MLETLCFNIKYDYFLFSYCCSQVCDCFLRELGAASNRANHVSFLLLPSDLLLGDPRWNRPGHDILWWWSIFGCTARYGHINWIPIPSLLFAGLAGGTILYVVMFEVLQREKEKEVSGIFQLLGIVLGFSAMMVLEVLGILVYWKYLIILMFILSPPWPLL